MQYFLKCIAGSAARELTRILIREVVYKNNIFKNKGTRFNYGSNNNSDRWNNRKYKA